VDALIEAIQEFVNQHNANPHGFVRTAQAGDILEKIRRARVALDTIPSE
jgi:selenocysteine lyase/cysteine desulfurase